jgi:hypothetical protein
VVKENCKAMISLIFNFCRTHQQQTEVKFDGPQFLFQRTELSFLSLSAMLGNALSFALFWHRLHITATFLWLLLLLFKKCEFGPEANGRLRNSCHQLLMSEIAKLGLPETVTEMPEVDGDTVGNLLAVARSEDGNFEDGLTVLPAFVW